MLLVCCVALAGQAAAQDPAAATADVIEGPAVALDGDTLLVGGAPVRLFGIDAPDMIAPLGPHARAKLDEPAWDTPRSGKASRSCGFLLD